MIDFSLSLLDSTRKADAERNEGWLFGFAIKVSFNAEIVQFQQQWLHQMIQNTIGVQPDEDVMFPELDMRAVIN